MRSGLAPVTTLLLGLMAFSSGCRDDRNDGGAQVEGTEIALGDDETDLVSRRDALLETRRALALKRADLDDKREKLVATGADTAVIQKEVTQLVIKEAEVQKQALDLTDELLRRVKDQQSQLSTVAGRLGGEGRVAVRESSIASRETELARRERELATRELALATREEKLATKWKDSCGTSGHIFTMPMAPAGTKYRKRDVEKSLRKARAAMRKRGILASDLSPELRSLRSETEKAMKKGEYAQANFAAEQLANGVDVIRINKAFVSTKFSRVQASVKNKKLSDRDTKLLVEITEDYGDARYKAANRGLNAIISR